MTPGSHFGGGGGVRSVLDTWSLRMLGGLDGQLSEVWNVDTSCAEQVRGGGSCERSGTHDLLCDVQQEHTREEGRGQGGVAGCPGAGTHPAALSLATSTKKIFIIMKKPPIFPGQISRRLSRLVPGICPGASKKGQALALRASRPPRLRVRRWRLSSLPSRLLCFLPGDLLVPETPTRSAHSCL